ncbi:MAG: hypothetical protein IJ630_04330 [Treponema sp.]|nr:hypothetical protein [Treponema sp.]
MAENWYEVKQNHNLGYKMMFFILKTFPAVFMRLLAFPVGFFYWAFGKKARLVSKDYLLKIQVSLLPDFDKSKKLPLSTLKHISSFALNLVENVQSWAGKFSFSDVSWQNDDVFDLVKNINSSKGSVILISHLGNAQMMKGLASMGESGTEKKMSITTISDAKISQGLTALLNEINPASSMNIISSDNIGPETIILLQERLEKGEVIVIAGDRISAHTDRNIEIEFLGETARFPYGVFLLIALLNAPTYFVTGLREKDFSLHPKYDMFVKKNPLDFDCTRSEREERIKETARNYAKNLESLSKMHPYQWYNFFDFWG